MVRLILRIALVACGALAAALPGRGEAAEPNAEEIVSRMQAALWPGTDARARMQVTATNPTGEKTDFTASYSRIGDRLLRISIDGPPELRGFDFCAESRESGAGHIHIYMPLVRRVREVDINMRKETFLGTDFNYEDFGFEDLAAQQHRLIGEVERDGQSYYQIESVPKQDWMYAKLVRLIDKRTFLPTETEYHCWGVEVCRLRKIERVERVGAYDFAAEVTMTDTLRQQATRLVFAEIEVDVGLPTTSFHCRGGN